MGYSVIVYFFNPNIFPEEEYQKRLDAQKVLCEYFNCKLIIADYNPDEYFDFVKGLENEPEKGIRCDKCFEFRLRRTAQMAQDLNIPTYTTSIGISPHKDFEKLTQIGEDIAQEFNLEYFPENFKKKDGFLKTNQISKSLGLYRQNYCGCKFSIRN